MINGCKFELWSEMERNSFFFSLVFAEERAVRVDVVCVHVGCRNMCPCAQGGQRMMVCPALSLPR